MRVGVVADTHGLLRPEALDALRAAAVEHILHAGDVGDPGILDRLHELAPVTAIRGNIDRKGPCAQLPATECIELAGRLVYLVHSVHDLDLDPVSAGIALVVSGHSHAASVEQRGPVLYVNPGSCGPRRFRLPITLALAELSPEDVFARIVPLEITVQG